MLVSFVSWYCPSSYTDSFHRNVARLTSFEEFLFPSVRTVSGICMLTWPQSDLLQGISDGELTAVGCTLLKLGRFTHVMRFLQSCACAAVRLCISDGSAVGAMYVLRD